MGDGSNAAGEDGERALLERARGGDPRAKDEVVRRYLKMVHAIAHRWRGLGDADHDDLVSAGLVGLLRAMELYEFDRGAKFSSYAATFVSRHVMTERGFVVDRVGLHRELRSKLHSIGKTLEDAVVGSQNPEAAVRAALKESHVTPTRAHRLFMAFAEKATELDAPASTDEPSSGTRLERFDAGAGTVEDALVEVAARTEVAERVRAAMRTLPHRERWILERRHMDEEPRSQSEVADALGITESRVSQIEAKAIAKVAKAIDPSHDGRKAQRGDDKVRRRAEKEDEEDRAVRFLVDRFRGREVERVRRSPVKEVVVEVVRRLHPDGWEIQHGQVDAELKVALPAVNEAMAARNMPPISWAYFRSVAHRTKVYSVKAGERRRPNTELARAARTQPPARVTFPVDAVDSEAAPSDALEAYRRAEVALREARERLLEERVALSRRLAEVDAALRGRGEEGSEVVDAD